MGDPKRVVGAYITDVEATEEQQLAAGDAKAQEAAVAISPDEPARRAARSSRSRRRRRRPTCSARPKGAGDRARSRSPTSCSSARTASAATSSTAASALDVRIRLRAPLADRRLRHRHRHLQRRRRLLLRHEHAASRSCRASASVGDAEATFAIESLDLVEGTYKLDVAVHKLRRLSVRLPPAALHVPREVAHARTSASTVRATSGGSRTASAARSSPETHAVRLERRRLDAFCRAGRAAYADRRAAAAQRSSSPTASSTCCTRVTCATCSRRARSATCSSSA